MHIIFGDVLELAPVGLLGRGEQGRCIIPVELVSRAAQRLPSDVLTWRTVGLRRHEAVKVAGEWVRVVLRREHLRYERFNSFPSGKKRTSQGPAIGRHRQSIGPEVD